MADLRPLPMRALVRRMFRELDREDAIFDLPARKFFLGDPEKDLSVSFHGRRVSAALGPAAGPQTQLAQNLVLSWLGGCRILELKTVQIQDELDIPRPCIDMTTIGLNAEWSQELKLEESLEEYVKGAMLIRMLVASGKVALTPGFDRVHYDMSVGYDLAGIRSDRVRAFVDGMRNARAAVDRLRKEIPAEYRELRDLDYPTDLSDTVTLSTFHGCPPNEIERIILHLLESGLHAIVKFNPMLLGPAETRRLLHDALGYTDLIVPESAFERDTKWDEAAAMVERLGERARELGLGFGAKFSNTLIVENNRGFLAPGEREVYLSGPPLHVLAMNLVARFRRTFADRFPISFAAGIDRGNFADAAAIGLTPITVCSDLLKPQGYARAQGYQKELVKRMTAAGARTTGDYVIRAYGLGEAALERAGADPEARRTCVEALAAGGDLRDAAGEELYARWVSEAILANTERYIAAATADPRYARARNEKPPKKIGRRLWLFDCISCDKCIPVCPNDANFRFFPEAREIPCAVVERTGDGWTWREGEPLVLAEAHQIGNFADFCNDCGNCDVFCPEDGGPFRLKPRFFGSEAAWREDGGEGYFLERSGGTDRMLGRREGRETELTVAGNRVTVSGEGYRVTYDSGDPEGTVRGEGEGPVDLTDAAIMDAIRRGAAREDRVNYVNVLLEDTP